MRPLVDLAFKALFQEIYYQLQYCHEQNELQNALDDSTFASALSLPQQVSNIRDKLGPFLVGPFSDIRKKLIVEFTNGHLCKNPHQVDSDSEVCLAFFDCILDDSFKECDASSKAVATCFPVLNKLLEVLAFRSPKMESVKVQTDNTRMTLEIGQSCVQSLKKFTNLTSLFINWTTPYDGLNFFSSLSDSCPHLSKLDLGKLCFSISQLFALMFGSKYYQLPGILQPKYLATSGALHQLEFQQADLTSICSSLKEFECKNFCDVVERKSEFWADPSAIAFFLRHFRHIQKISHNCLIHQCEAKICSGVTKLLEETTTDDSKMTTISFSSESLGFLHLTSNAPFIGILFLFLNVLSQSVIIFCNFDFIGHLNLIELEEVDIRSRKVMLMVQSLCPNLKSIRFRQNNPMEDTNQSGDIISVDELKSMLAVEANWWSKVNNSQFKTLT